MTVEASEFFDRAQQIALDYLKKAIEEDQRNRILARHDRDFDTVRDTPGFQELLAS